MAWSTCIGTFIQTFRDFFRNQLHTAGYFYYSLYLCLEKYSFYAINTHFSYILRGMYLEQIFCKDSSRSHSITKFIEVSDQLQAATNIPNCYNTFAFAYF